MGDGTMLLTRRGFLGASAAAVIAGTMGRSAVFGANNRIGVGVVGFNDQGGSHIRDILKKVGVEIVALCDVDREVLEQRAAEVKTATGKKPKLYRDVPEVMPDDAVDVVTIATPNHWHSLIAVWACQAGKDVYVEKPLSHSIWEGRQLVTAAEKYGRVVQHGTQSRSDTRLIRDIGLIHQGFIGKVMRSRGYAYKNDNRYAIGHGKPATPPDNLDWNLWQGPAQASDCLVNIDADPPKGFFNYKNEPIPVEASEPEGGDKWDRFFNTVRTRDMTGNPAPPQAGHPSCILCHVGNIAYRLGRSLEFDPTTETFKDEEANRMARRNYREGFEVPAIA